MNYQEKWIDIIVGTTLPTLDLFRQHKNGADAFYLFFLYLKQSRVQDNKETFSLDKFMIKATWWWHEKFKRAKKVLRDLWMIRQIKKRDDNWKIIWHYIWVSHKYRLSTSSKNHPSENTTSSKTRRQNTPVVELLNTPVDKLKEKEKSKKENPPYFENDLLNEKFKEFLADRKERGKTATTRGIALLISKLNHLARTNTTKIKIIEQSIERWRSWFFEIKDNWWSARPQKWSEWEKNRFKKKRKETWKSFLSSFNLPDAI